MTTFSQGELESLDSELIIATMEELDANADLLLRVLVPAEATQKDIEKNLEELDSPNSRLTKSFKKKANILSATQDDTFGSQTYIRPDIILRRLFSVESVQELPESHWRPDAIFYEANLATFVSQLCRMTADKRDLDMLNSLDQNFPTPFMSETGVGSSKLTDETFELALELRTQLAIKYIADEAPQTYEKATQYICSLFIDPDAEEPSYDTFGVECHPRAWKGLADPAQDITQILLQRVEELRRPFNEGKDPGTALREVEMAFPWLRFQIKLLYWAQLRTQEINDMIAEQGGSPAVIDALKRELDRRSHHSDAVQKDTREESQNQLAEGPTEDREAREQDQPIGEQPQPARAVFATNTTSSNALGKKSWTRTKEAMSMLRRARQSQSASTQPVSAVPSLSSTRHTPVDAHEDGYYDIDDLVPDEPLEPESPMKKLLNSTLERDSRENKENQSRTLPRRTLFDTQEDGERVEFDEDFASQEQSAPNMQANAVQFRLPVMMQSSNLEAVSSTKRSRPPYLEDLSEDEGFEADNRERPPKRTRVEYAKPTDQGRVSTEASQRSQFPELPRAGPSHGFAAREKSTTQPQASASVRPRKNPGQSLDYKAPRLASIDGDDVPALTPADQYKLVSHQAKNKRRVNISVKPPRQRKPWEDQEVDQLIALIGKYGCSYSLLKEMDHENILADRHQGDLKDKARNIKTDYLIAGWELPPNFENVILDRKAILRCEKYGVTVDQAPQRGRKRRVHIVDDGDDYIEDVGEDEAEE